MRSETQVAGISFAVSADKELAHARPAGHATIVLDPENRFAKHPRGAFAVFWQGKKIGFIPDQNRALQDEIVNMMDNAIPFTVEIVRYAYKDKYGFNDSHAGSLAAITVAIVTDGDESFRVKDGITYGRISQFVKCFIPGDRTALDRWMIDGFRNYDHYLKYMSKVASEGTAMHRALEQYFKSQGRVVDAAHLPQKLKTLIETYDLKFIEGEETMFDNKTLLSGTYDWFGWVHDKRTVIDWKSATRVRLGHRLQSCWYAHCKSQEINEPVCAMVVAWGGYDVWMGTPEQVDKGYEIIRHLVRSTALSEELS